ncbi:hypothetical protein [Actinopolymorpha singaporensis]|uniref:DUF8129 domain-containing protein n=1 Tax=Actinopolymorpha singaporensis TaxID=117157 RepID=A0A1H1VNW5_9ACTN|nr:hypothetical protein [Actinopolymorpha singaporensis]SDS86608.1 hypothetical protein SAMN04489717_4153 [Actinopolymorpha singaporensis]
MPLPDYDHLPEGSLQHRIRSLSADEIGTLLDYEREHGNRLPVITVLEARIEQLHSGASPSEGGQDVRPEQTGAPAGGSQVEPGTGADSGTPLRHGVAGQTPKRGRD